MTEPLDAQALVARLDLQPHPEGGYFRETYRANQRVTRDSENDPRSASTAIYYLLCDGAHSAWHRIRSDEVWHFHAGDPLFVHVLDANGALTTHTLGNMLLHKDAVFQAVVHAGHWFAAECSVASGASLVGCTVAPGFEFSEFELADCDDLKARYSQHHELIERLA
ncbi:cupin domain-containing protein [Caballeronia sp. LZ062]|uniref:cupin domain-containing protein n=1 Tax=unclassified Caballeronia TaxID=2646786 RepID=UPI00285AE809|nr:MULTISPECIES: cupin domain-containing protein [unclassified Caballeronia]MDR5856703.1 cupin domain-containing protein [Caballeronia sp. LZ050]MDR5869899.1 cupin domain-containing protein [Caballeronia sp. LZ062]